MIFVNTHEPEASFQSAGSEGTTNRISFSRGALPNCEKIPKGLSFLYHTTFLRSSPFFV